MIVNTALIRKQPNGFTIKLYIKLLFGLIVFLIIFRILNNNFNSLLIDLSCSIIIDKNYNYGLVAQWTRARSYEPRCQGFESLLAQYSYSIILIFYFGVSPSGKAADFDSAIRRFESCHPS